MAEKCFTVLVDKNGSVEANPTLPLQYTCVTCGNSLKPHFSLLLPTLLSAHLET